LSRKFLFFSGCIVLSLLFALAVTLTSAKEVTLTDLNSDPNKFNRVLVVVEGEMGEMEVIYSHFFPENPKSRVGFDWRLNQYGFNDGDQSINLRHKYLASYSLAKWVDRPEPDFWSFKGRVRVMGIWLPSDDEGHYHLRILKVWTLDETETGR
jgi:hypothetical protein